MNILKNLFWIFVPTMIGYIAEWKKPFLLVIPICISFYLLVVIPAINNDHDNEPEEPNGD